MILLATGTPLSSTAHGGEAAQLEDAGTIPVSRNHTHTHTPKMLFNLRIYKNNNIKKQTNKKYIMLWEFHVEMLTCFV